MARRYRKRPSEIAEFLSFDPVLAYDFDLAVMMRGIMHENEAVERSRKGGSPRAALGRLKERVESGEIEIVEPEAISFPGMN